MFSFSVRTTVYLQKWLSFISIIGCNALILVMGSCLGLSAFWLGSGLIGLVLFSAGVLFYASFPNRNQRLLNLDNEHEAYIYHCVETYSRKLGISPPRVIIHICAHNDIKLEMESIGFPFEQQLVMTQDWLEVLNHGLSQASFSALIAHELGHLKHHDTLLSLISSSLRFAVMQMLCLSFAMATYFLGTMPLATMAVVSVMCVITLSVELLVGLFNRAIEKQADLVSADITENPKATKQFIYDLYLQFLYFGKLVTQNEWAGRMETTQISPSLINDLKVKHAQLSELNASDVFDELQAIAKPPVSNKTAFSLPELKNRALTWLNTHPYVHDRVDCIERAYTRPSR